MTKALRQQAFGLILGAVDSCGKDDERLAKAVRAIVREVRELEANHRALVHIAVRSSDEKIPPLPSNFVKSKLDATKS